MATLTVFPSAGDGYVRNGSEQAGTPTWATIHDATSATTTPVIDYTSTTLEARTQFFNNPTYMISRAFLPFDTSSLPDDATINSATLSIFVISVDNSDTTDIRLVQTTQASTDSLVAEDYDQCGAISNPTEGAAAISLSSLVTNAYNDFTLNATGLGFISKTGFTKLGLRIGRDATNTAPTVSQNVVNISSSEATGTSQDPKLVIDYTSPTTTSTTTSTSTSSTSSSSSTTKTDTTTTTSTTTTSTSSTSSSTSSTSSSTSSTSTSTSSTSSSTTSTSSSTTMPFSLAVDNV